MSLFNDARKSMYFEDKAINTFRKVKNGKLAGINDITGEIITKRLWMM